MTPDIATERTAKTTTETSTDAAVRSLVLEYPPMPPAVAAAHFEEALRRYTDASDVYADLQAGVTDIIVVDVRSPELFARKHIPGAISIPHRTMGPETHAVLPLEKVIVTYCNGIGCNGSTKAAMKLARLGYQVKELIGGIAFWEYEGLPVESSTPVAACDTRGHGVDCGC